MMGWPTVSRNVVNPRFITSLQSIPKALFIQPRGKDTVVAISYRPRSEAQPLLWPVGDLVHIHTDGLVHIARPRTLSDPRIYSSLQIFIWHAILILESAQGDEPT